ncbi:MAG TPA: hypothetical protein VJV75_09345, partial [Candidatus Polarisedimenticolia bacterium]|nr:hypothetical protein [Candidatus Polarisedimenticolia bacterium]
MPGRLFTRRTLAIAIVVVLAFAAAIVTGACHTTTLPPELSTEQQNLIRTTRFDATVGVEAYDLPVYSERLLGALRATALFRQVDPIGAFKTPPDLIARVERPVSGDAALPLKTALTLGIVPTILDEKHGQVFSLRSGKAQGDALGIECTFTGRTTLGWLAAALNFLPNHAMKDSTFEARMAELLALQLATGRDSIEVLRSG